MNNFNQQPSTSSGPVPVTEESQEKGNAIFEYRGANGETVLFEAPESSIYYDDEGNAVVCTENLEEFSQDVVHEEIIEYEDEAYAPEPSTSHITNKSAVFKESFSKGKPLLTNKCLQSENAALFGKPGKRKKQDPSEVVQSRTVNENGSILNRNIPCMKNMFKVVSDSARMKVEKTFKKENDEKRPETPTPDGTLNQEKGGVAEEDEDDDEEELPPKLEKCPNSISIENEEDPGNYDHWPIFSKSAIDFKDACEILVEIIHVPSHKICKSVPMEYKQEGTFVIDLRTISQSTSILNDENGKWGQPSGKCRYYKEDKSGKLIRADDGKGKLKEWTTDFTYKIILKRYDNLATKNASDGLGHFQKKIYTAYTPTDKSTIYAIISYSWLNGRAWNFELPPDPSKEKASTGTKRVVKNWEGASIDKASLTSMPQIISAFFEGFNLYSHNAINYNQASSILLGAINVDANKKCGSVPTGFKQNGTFVIDLKRMGYNTLELRRDDNGIWTKPSGFSRFYKFAANGDAVRVDKGGKLMEGIDYDVKVMCKRYEHPQTGKNFVKKIYTLKGKNEEHYKDAPGLAVIVYFWKGKPIPFDPMFKQNNVNTEKAEFAKLQEMDEEEDCFVEAPAAGAEPELVENVVEAQANQPQVPTRKRQRFEPQLEHVIVTDEHQMNEMKMDVLRREHENQDRFSMILDRAESLLSRLEQRVTVIEYETGGTHVWHQDGSEVIEEEVIEHDMNDYQ